MLTLRPLLVLRILVVRKSRQEFLLPSVATLKISWSVNTAHEPESSFTTSPLCTTPPSYFWNFCSNSEIFKWQFVPERSRVNCSACVFDSDFRARRLVQQSTGKNVATRLRRVVEEKWSPTYVLHHGQTRVMEKRLPNGDRVSEAESKQK